MTIYNTNNKDIKYELGTLRTAYSNLQDSYLLGDRARIEYVYNNIASLQIPGIKQRIHFETQKIIYSKNPYSIIGQVPINDLPIDQLGYNVQGCLNALQNEIWLRELYLNNNSFAQRKIFRADHTFSPSEVLDSNPNGELKVDDLLSVLKYASSIAEAISPENEDYARASATITVYQAIYAILNNRHTDNNINMLLHLMVSFLSTTVKRSLNNPDNKRSVTLNSIIVDLAIDFFCKK